MRLVLVGMMVLAVACGDDAEPGGDDGGETFTGSGAGAGSSTGSSMGGSSGTAGGTTSGGGNTGGSSGGGKEAICAAYAQLAIDCCTPDVPNCQPDTYDGWYQFCFEGYEGCQAAYDCLAEATCATAEDCPNFGSGCQ